MKYSSFSKKNLSVDKKTLKKAWRQGLAVVKAQGLAPTDPDYDTVLLSIVNKKINGK